MKEKIYQFLKSHPKLAGAQESYLMGVAEMYGETITDEASILTTFNDGVIDLLKMNTAFFQKEGDRRANDAIEKFRKKNNLDEFGKPAQKEERKKPEQKEETEEMPGWFKPIAEKYKSIEAKLEEFEREKTQSNLIAKVTSKLKEKDIPESYFKGRINLSKEEEVEGLISGIETDYTAFRTEMVEKGLIVTTPKTPAGQAKEGEAFAKEIAEARNKGGNGNPAGVEGKKII